jgi:Protein of unknown function (DUF1573)
MRTCIVLLAVLYPALAWSQPSIEFQTEQHDFGVVRQGEQLEFNFEVTNAGTGVLDIQSINTS